MLFSQVALALRKALSNASSAVLPPPFSLRRVVSFFFAGAPALALILVLTGLYAADRILVQRDDAQVAADVNLSAARLQSLLTIHVVSLESFHGLFGMGDQASRQREFASLVGVLSRRTPGFHAIRVVSAESSIVLDTVIARPMIAGELFGPGMTAILERTIHTAQAVRKVTFTPSTQAVSGMRMFAMVAPIVRGDSLVGTASGIVTEATMLEAMGVTSPSGENLPDDSRRRLVITSLSSSGDGGEDTLARFDDPRSAISQRSADVLLTVPGGDRWKIRVVHAATGWPMRAALWAVGLAALWGLAVGSLRERDQSRRIAERSDELEHLSTELLHANRAKSEFLANVSHELRTPLNAIVGFVDLLRDGVYGELAPRQISPVERIAASATHLRHLVDQVLDLAKITAGRLEVHTDVVDLRAFVMSVASEMESLITERGLALSLAVGASLPRLRTDPTHLRQILVNLIGNAIKYTNAGTISIRARLVGLPADATRPGGRLTPDATWLQPMIPPGDGIWVAIQVIDTGIGIAAADCDRIFDEFEQVGAGPRGDSMRRGTGLGLSISRRLARLLGGDVVVDSVLGKGSTFTLWLPIDPTDLDSQNGGHSTAVAPLRIGLV